MKVNINGWVGLVEVVGGKMWYLWDNYKRDSLYFHSKKECEAAIREIYKDDANVKHRLLCDLFAMRGKAYILR